MTAVSIEAGTDRNLDSLGPAVQDAICLRAGIKVEKPHERAESFRHMSLMEMGRRYLEACGVADAVSLSRTEVSRLLFSRMAFARKLGATINLAMSTSDFPFILANVLGKSLRESYTLATTTWQLWAARGTAPDFKQQSAVILSSAPALTVIPEGGEYQFGALTEGREVYTIAKYGKGLKFTREMLINDDLGAFNRIIPQMGAKAKYLEDIVAYGVLTANANMADAVPLFNAAHANVGAGTITVAGLTTGFTAMGLQTDIDGVTLIENTPAVLIVSKARQIVAEQLIMSQYDPAIVLNPQVPNPFASRLKVCASPVLDGTSAAVWYLSANPAMIDTVLIVFLEGEEQPVLEEEEDFDTDARKYKVRHQIVGKALDWRGLYSSTGV